ncbi:unnamed protein product [Amoebophrya sp. A25]|nr:unnamed protein product [Amoebophrya sp. A25]|eukprot:GSA25T00027671001.1
MTSLLRLLSSTTRPVSNLPASTCASLLEIHHVHIY